MIGQWSAALHTLNLDAMHVQLSAIETRQGCIVNTY